MSEPSPNFPQGTYDPQYYTPAPAETSRTVLLLVTIFNYIAAGIDLAWALFLAGASVVVPIMIGRDMAHGGPGSPPPMWLFVLIYGGMAILSAGVGVVKLIAARKIQKRARNAWGWGLAAGICGCPQLWCSLAFVLPLAAGVFTIVIMCRQDVRNTLSAANPPAPAF